MIKRALPCMHGVILISLLGVAGCYATSDGGPFDVSAQGGGFPFTHDDLELVSQKAWEGCLEVSEDTVLDSHVPCIIVGADGIRIDLNGFTVNGAIFGAKGWNDVVVRNGTVAGGAIVLGTGTLLDHLTVRDGQAFVVQINGGLITDSRFERNSVGVDLYWGNGIEVRDCHFVENDVGVNIASDNNSKVINSHFEANGVGVNIWDEDHFGSSGSNISRNIFRHNDLGVYLHARSEANETHISENLFLSNSSSGIIASLGCAMEVTTTCAGRGTIIEKNLFFRNGDDPRTLTGYLPLPYDLDSEPYEVVADDGLIVLGVEELNTADGVTVIGNTAVRNADLGFDVAGVIDGGANLARKNGNPLGCVGVLCERRNY